MLNNPDDDALKLIKAIQAMTDKEYQDACFYDGDDMYIVLNGITYAINKNPE